jgi:hypothetical protein
MPSKSCFGSFEILKECKICNQKKECELDCERKLNEWENERLQRATNKLLRMHNPVKRQCFGQLLDLDNMHRECRTCEQLENCQDTNISNFDREHKMKKEIAEKVLGQQVT